MISEARVLILREVDGRGMPEINRPFGVTLLALLALLCGLVYLAAALGLFGTALLADESVLIDQLGPETPRWIVDNYLVVFFVLGILALTVALLFFLALRGLLRGRPWAWTLAVVVTVLSLLSNLLSVYAQGLGDPVTLANAAMGFILAALIMAYLYTQRVRRFFGKL